MVVRGSESKRVELEHIPSTLDLLILTATFAVSYDSEHVGLAKRI